MKEDEKNLTTPSKPKIIVTLKVLLAQGSQTRGPPDVFVRPATSLKLLKLLLKLLFL